MRNIFTRELTLIAAKNKGVIFMTGDLGFRAFESMQDKLGPRFINMGVAEQNMVTAAAGMSHTGLQVWTYSIAPFLILKTVEQVRNNICHPKMNVKLIGNGGGYGYGIMGRTHHILEDIAILSTLPHICLHVPAFNEDVPVIVKRMNAHTGPDYLRLGLVPKWSSLTAPKKYSKVRKIISSPQAKSIVICLGPMVHQAYRALIASHVRSYSLWVVSELPFGLSSELAAEITLASHIYVIEEACPEGSLGSHVLALITRLCKKMPIFHHIAARGYLSGKSGDQAFHLRENHLDTESLTKLFCTG